MTEQGTAGLCDEDALLVSGMAESLRGRSGGIDSFVHVEILKTLLGRSLEAGLDVHWSLAGRLASAGHRTPETAFICGGTRAFSALTPPPYT